MSYRIAKTVNGKTMYLEKDLKSFSETGGYVWVQEKKALNVFRNLPDKDVKIVQYDPKAKPTPEPSASEPPKSEPETPKIKNSPLDEFEIKGPKIIKKAKQVLKEEKEREEKQEEQRRLLQKKKQDAVSTSDISVEKIKDISIFLSNVNAYVEKLRKEIQHEDLIEQDLMHAMEVDSFSASGGYKYSKLMKESRIRRREAKNMLTALQRLTCDGINPQSAIDYINSIDKRKYSPRVLKGLFEEMAK